MFVLELFTIEELEQYMKQNPAIEDTFDAQENTYATHTYDPINRKNLSGYDC